MEPIGAQKKTHDIAELGQPSAASTTGEDCCRCGDALGTIPDALRLDHAAPGSGLAIRAGVRDPVPSRRAPGKRYGWEPCGLGPSRRQPCLLDAHRVA